MMSTAEDRSKPRCSATTHPQRQLATGLGIGAGRVTRAGLAAAAANGRKFGRPRKVDDAEHIATARRMKADGHTGRDIAKYLGVSRATLYRYLTDEAA